MGRIHGQLIAALVCLGAIVAPVRAAYQIVHNFGSPAPPNAQPANPRGSLLASGPLMYGMTSENLRGTLFQLNTTTNTFTPLHPFGTTSDGFFPQGNVIQSGSKLYGMTSARTGALNGGTIFSYDTSTATYNVLHSFSSSANPRGSLVLSGNSLYGLTRIGGTVGSGVLFQYNLSNGAYTALHNFAGGTADGASPLDSVILDGTKLYGLTSAGGAANSGTIFRYDTSNSSYAVLHSFPGGAGGADPRGSLLLFNNKLYGTTFSGGTGGDGTIFAYDPVAASQQIVYSFKGSSFLDGENPHDSLIAAGGKLYGMTQGGGQFGFSFGGTVFEFDPATSTESVLHHFGGPVTSQQDGETAVGSVTLAGSTLYGMTQFGGTSGGGVIFNLDLPEPSACAVLAAIATALLLRRNPHSRD